eukprot:6221317-Pyramimonas_sp.AAC.1
MLRVRAAQQPRPARWADEESCSICLFDLLQSESWRMRHLWTAMLQRPLQCERQAVFYVYAAKEFAGRTGGVGRAMAKTQR